MDKLTPKWGAFGGSGSSGHSQGSKEVKSSKKATKRPPPFSLRLSFKEKEQLREDAGRQSLAAYIKSRLFDTEAPIRQARGLNPVKDHKALAQVLGLLGSSRISDNLTELAEAARVGAMPIGDEADRALKRASDDIRIMRKYLLAALGIRESDDQSNVCESCSSAFTRASSESCADAQTKEPTP